MKTINFTYWTNLMFYGGNVGGVASVDLSEEDEKAFRDAIPPAYESGDMMEYFRNNLSEDLSEEIRSAIYDSYARQEAANAIDSYGIDAFTDISESEYDSLDDDEKIERLLDEVHIGEDYNIVDIKIEE